MGKVLGVPGNRDVMARISRAANPACSGLCSPAARVVFRARSCHCLDTQALWVGRNLIVCVSVRERKAEQVPCMWRERDAAYESCFSSAVITAGEI